MTKRIATKSLAPLLAAAALPFTPALAQEISTPTVQAPPAAATPAPAPEAAAPAPATVFAAPKPVVQNAPPPGPQAEDLARQAQADAAARRSARSAPAPRAAAPVRAERVTQTTTTTAAPVAAAPAAVTPAPAPEAVPTPAEAPTVAAPVADTPTPAATTQQTTTTTTFNWTWIGVAIAAIAAIGALLFFRRRRAEEEVYYDDTVYEEPAYAEPVAVAEPMVAPVHEPEVIASRPQIELGIRPIRAGSDNGQARVDYEVIVENAGALDARDVTVTSWLLDASSSEAESNMIERQVNVAAGDVTTVQGSATVDGARGAFRPVVATDARYTLPDGTEGHIAARFAVGVDGGEPGRITPIVLDRDELREDLGARLEGEVERV
jgi:hypothetical protein